MWYYNNKEFNETPEEYQGFVYEIRELSTNKKYIGKKNFWRPKTLPKNSRRSRKLKTRSLKEGIGMASKAAGNSTAPKKSIISESNDMVSRFQKLANITIK